MSDFGIDVNNNIQNGLLNIVPIPKEFEENQKVETSSGIKWVIMWHYNEK